MDSLFKDYQKHEIPGGLDGQPTIVTVYMSITEITSVDVRMMDYTTYLLLRQEWNDPRLAWNEIPQFRNYTKNLVAPELKHMLWLPDLFFRNGKEGRVHRMTLPNYLTRISPDGMVLYSQKITMRFSCQMDLATFPMDVQECNMNIGSYGHTLDELRFVWREKNPIELAKGTQIAEFNCPETVAAIDCNAQPPNEDNTSCLIASFLLTRQLGSWFSSVYITNFLIVIASWHSFWVDVDAQPARVSLGLLTLLGMITQASGISQNLPRVSYIKAIDVWNIACIIFNVSVLIEFAVASNLVAKEKRHERWRSEAREALRREVLGWCLACRQGLVERQKNVGGARRRSDMESEILEALYPDAYSRSSIFPADVLRMSNSSDSLLSVDSDRESTEDYDEREGENMATAGAASFDEKNPNITKSVEKTSRRDKKPRVSKIDVYSRVLFPLCFFIYNCCYWVYYLVLVKKK